MEIIRIPVLSDNYIFVLYDPHKKIAAVVDPAEAQPVLDCLNSLNAELVAIFNTHHHGDHVGGNNLLIKQYPNLVVYASQQDQGRIPGQKVFLKEGDGVEFGDRQGQVYFVPGHTRGHIAYYFPPTKTENTPELFCGDTLFAGGCGRLFEGTPAQMVESLSKLRTLPDNTRIWCAHEYTLGNLKFALTVDPHNPELQKRYIDVTQCRQNNQPTIPSVLEIEKQTNPFLRWDHPNLKETMGGEDPVHTFAKIRGKKDQF
jgi:hydroxyacylglutathione hydrolase